MRHATHMLDRSPWPILVSLNALFMLLGLVSYVTGYSNGLTNTSFSFFILVYLISLWFYDIITESLFLGFHTYKISTGLIYGFLLFLLTEIMLFFAFFWGYFNNALNPFYIIWPPVGIDLINPWSIPLLNTFLLLYSGIICTWAHHCFLQNKRSTTIKLLSIGISLGVIFFILQVFEYFSSSYDISDSAYGTTFFCLTGAHGLHVIVGVSFLIVCLIRLINYNNPHVIFDLGMLYYHFVDIVWIILFILIYYLAY